MITPREYQRQLDQLLNLADSAKIPTLVTEEPVFNVDLNTREIEIPKQFKNLAVYSDHMAETIWFAVDRYYDGIDLYRKRVAIQYVNALGEEGLDILDTYDNNVSGDKQPDVYTSHDDLGRYNKISEGEILIAWKLDYAITKASGPIQFSLRFFEVDKTSPTTLSYNLTTKTATVNILSGLYITENSTNPILPKTKLEDLVDKIYEAYGQNELKLYDYNQITQSTMPHIDGVRLQGNIDSSSLKIAQYQNLQNLPTLNGHQLIGNMTSSDLEISVDADTQLNLESVNPVQNKVITGALNTTNGNVTKLTDRITLLENSFNELTFVPINITSFIVQPNIKEHGDTIDNVLLSWTYNTDKNPKELFLNEELLEDVSLKEKIIEETFTETTTFKLKAVDAFGNISEKESVLNFVNGIYYNSAPIPQEYNSDFINSLAQRALSIEKNLSLDFEVADGQYAYICTPDVNGDYIFTIGGFDGGFGKFPDATIEFTNEFGHTEMYRIYKSDNTNLGKTRVELS